MSARKGATRAASTLHQRLAQLEQLISRQQDQIAAQQVEMQAQREEIAHLRAAPAALAAHAPLAPELPTPPSHPAPDAPTEPPVAPAPARSRAKSRRALLKLGGAAAAAGVAAVAAGATELAHPGTARANGVQWQTGIVNADNQTFVEPATGSFPDPALLTVRVGTGNATYRQLFAPSNAAIAAYDISGGGACGVYATSSSGTAMYGLSNTFIGVRGETTGGYGVFGLAASGYGVGGASTSGRGVQGESTSGTGVFGSSGAAAGVYGQTVTGTGVYGTSGGSGGIGVWGSGPGHDVGVFGESASGYGGVFQGGQAPLYLQAPGGVIGPPTSGGHNFGELFVDDAGVLWYCTVLGTPGTWIRVCGPQFGVAGGAVNYLSAPIRIFDSRVGQPAPLPASKAPLAAGSTTTIQVTGTAVGGLSVPAGATGVIGNLTVTDTRGGGDLIMYPAGAPQPLTSNINYAGGQTVANSVNVGLSSGGAVELYVHVNGTDVIFDVAGYVM